MLASELIRKIHKIEIRTRGLTQQIFAGEYHSAFKGQGMAFSEVREYQFGDPIRNIDWNVTARFNRPFVKIFEEERELTMMLLVDVSGSNEFGTRERFKRELMTELAAVFAFSAIQNNDKIGVILFSDKVEKYIPPKKGKKHIMRIILEVLNFKPTHHGTNVGEAIRYFTHLIKKRAIAIVISDFLLPREDDYAHLRDALRLARKKHDLVGIQVLDHGEKELPNIGLVQLIDPETGKTTWVDSSSRSLRKNMQASWSRQEQTLKEIFQKTGIDFVPLATNEDYVKPLVQLFKKRGARR